MVRPKKGDRHRRSLLQLDDTMKIDGCLAFTMTSVRRSQSPFSDCGTLSAKLNAGESRVISLAFKLYDASCK